MYLIYINTLYPHIKLRLTYLFLVLTAALWAQNVTIKGKAHESYAGKIVELFSINDYITNTRQKETSDTIGKDGYFELVLQAEKTRLVFIKIEQVAAQLYVQPDFVYGITIPEIRKELDYQNGAELPVNIGIVGSDSTELNALIFDYQEVYNSFFLTEDSRYLARATIFKLADSLQKTCYSRYAKINNAYFRSYVIYSIASINASVSRGEQFLIRNYILNKPVQYTHHEYMSFFNACFKGYLNSIASQRKGPSLYHIINVKADYNLLYDFVQKDKLLNSDTLRELIILQNLWDFYFSADFVPEAVENIVGQLKLQTRIKVHQQIAASMLAYFNKMQVGSPAPVFSALAKDGSVAGLSQFKGRWIYLNFFSTKNVESLKEMMKISSLRKKYSDKVVFLSICLDDSVKAYTNYLKANPKFDWTIWYNNEKSVTQTAKDLYSVTGTEAYFLINNFGYLAQSPALAPSQGIEYRFNVIFKIKKRNTKTGIR